MAGDRFYIVVDVMQVDGAYDHFLKDYPTEEKQLGALCYGYAEGGMESDTVARIINGMGYREWKGENAVLYSDKAAAVADAKKRLAAFKKSERVASRFLAANES